MSIDKIVLYIQMDQTWNQHQCDHQVGKYHRHYTMIDSIPNKIIQTETTYVNSYYHATLPTIKLRPLTIQPQTLGQRLQGLPLSIQQIVKYIILPPDEGRQIYQQMCSKTLLCASEGSLKDNIATYS